jgi:tRNA nucleotidyltransferase (CCA-adding enzyme)
MNFLKKIQKETFLDPEKRFKNQKEAFREVNQSKLLSPLVLIDPTNKYRNVCAGLNNESLEKLRISAKELLKNPSEDFFKIEEFREEEFFEKAKEKKLKVLRVELETNRENKDIAGTKMKKFFNFLIRELNLKEQEVVYSEFVYNQGKKSQGYLTIREKTEVKIIGPKKGMKEAIEKFKKVRKKIYFSKGFACVKEKFNLDEFIKRTRRVSEEMGVNFSYNLS